jgi:hypothetical protein
MRDYKYRELLLGAGDWNQVVNDLSSIKSECLKECASAFEVNMTRTASFAIMPAEISFMARRDQSIYDNSNFKVTGKPVSLDDFIGKEIPEGVQEEAGKMIDEFRSEPEDKKNRLKAVFGLNYIETMLKVHPAMQASMDAMLNSIIIDSWLFFEAFASDLWCVGVDNGGNIIAGRVVAYQGWEKGDMLASSVPSTIFRARTQPRSYRREIGQASFQKLRSIKQYFKAAFGTGIEKLFDDVDSGYIHALSDVRNCIAHSAGKVDAQFLNRAKRFQEFAQLKVGEKLLLDGALVKKLRDAAFKTGVALLMAIDEMLTRGD